MSYGYLFVWRCNVFIISRHKQWLDRNSNHRLTVCYWRLGDFRQFKRYMWVFANDAWKLQNLHRVFSRLQNIYFFLEICRICTCLKIAWKFWLENAEFAYPGRLVNCRIHTDFSLAKFKSCFLKIAEFMNVAKRLTKSFTDLTKCISSIFFYIPSQLLLSFVFFVVAPLNSKKKSFPPFPYPLYYFDFFKIVNIFYL